MQSTLLYCLTWIVRLYIHTYHRYHSTESPVVTNKPFEVDAQIQETASHIVYALAAPSCKTLIQSVHRPAYPNNKLQLKVTVPGYTSWTKSGGHSVILRIGFSYSNSIEPHSLSPANKKNMTIVWQITNYGHKEKLGQPNSNKITAYSILHTSCWGFGTLTILTESRSSVYSCLDTMQTIK